MIRRSSTYLIPVLLLSLFAAESLLLPQDVNAQQRDTTVVEAFTFSDTTSRQAWGHIYEYEGMVAFPEEGRRYEKIVMLYTLKCDGATTADRFGCGEWDYSTFTRVWDNDSTYWEIGRFITPYGIGLDLGPDGFTWEFDVTDYGPLLNGVKQMTAGNNQELLDLKFLFIEGIPARDPLSVTRLWTGGNKNYLKVTQDSILSPIEVTLDPEASQYRINTRPQGGNFNGGPNTDNCSEFCDREHSIAINGTTLFRWNVWNECGDNPVFPQGGTWLTDRAGWCPGAGVTTQHHELTSFVTPGEKITVDYDIENPAQFEPYGHWVFWADLISYGPPNFALDAGIEHIVSPSNADLYSRLNPTCAGPVIEVVGRGSDEVKTITFSYGFSGSDRISFQWEGSIPYLGSETIELPPLPLYEWMSGPALFEVEIVAVNGASDEYESNDFASSEVTIPQRLPANLTVLLQTNQLNAVSTSDYEMNVYDADGATVYNRSSFPTSELVEIPLDLPDGCYTFELVNPEGFGLDYWPIRDQLGTGSVKIVDEGGTTLKTFDPDFGNRISFSFTIPAPAAELDHTSLDFGPARVGDTVERVLQITPANTLGLWMKNIVFFSGGNVFKITEISPAIENDSVWIARGDTMAVSIEFRPAAEKAYTGRMLVSSNDARGVLRLETTGLGDNSVGSVNGDAVDRAKLSVAIDRDQTKLDWSLDSDASVGMTALKVYDSQGRVLIDQFGTAEARYRGSLAIEALPAGSYFLSVEIDGEYSTTGFSISR